MMAGPEARLFAQTSADDSAPVPLASICASVAGRSEIAAAIFPEGASLGWRSNLNAGTPRMLALRPAMTG
jgi:hypothetical protein